MLTKVIRRRIISGWGAFIMIFLNVVPPFEEKLGRGGVGCKCDSYGIKLILASFTQRAAQSAYGCVIISHVFIGQVKGLGNSQAGEEARIKEGPRLLAPSLSPHSYSCQLPHPYLEIPSLLFLLLSLASPDLSPPGI